MDVRKLALLALLLLFATSASAALTQAQCPWTDQINAVTVTGSYKLGCADYTWSHTQNSPDFNNYFVRATGDVTIADFNFNGKSFTVCSIADDDQVTLFVQAVDGNAEGIFCSFDSNSTVTAGDPIQGMQYLIYAIFVGIGGVFILIILVAVTIVILSKFGFGKMIKI